MYNFSFDTLSDERATATAPSDEHDEVDESSEESFPASDPPSWEPMHTGAPVPEPSPARVTPRRDIEPSESPLAGA